MAAGQERVSPANGGGVGRGWPVGDEGLAPIRQAGKPGLSLLLQFRLARLVGGFFRSHVSSAGCPASPCLTRIGLVCLIEVRMRPG
ncbi:MAG: hypothetical protein K6U80_20525 [Firmicutes bacterium]|nr:hypothetical protein [Bacillota bacterium]